MRTRRGSVGTTQLAAVHATLAAFTVAALSASSVAAQPQAAERALVFVDDVVPADKALATDASALTSGLCAAFAKDKRLDVMCAPDVRQILSFAATAAMVGTTQSPGNAVTDRLDRTQHVISAALRKEAGAWVLVVKGGPKAPEARPEAMFSDQPKVAVEQRADAQKKLLDALPSLVAKVAEGLLKPAAAAPMPPPAPLKPGG